MIYVDDPLRNTAMPRVLWCHMMTDGPIQELHAFAAKIGMSNGWFQNHRTHPHYDLSLNFRTRAIKAGAVPVSSVEMLRRCRKEVVKDKLDLVLPRRRIRHK